MIIQDSVTDCVRNSCLLYNKYNILGYDYKCDVIW